VNHFSNAHNFSCPIDVGKECLDLSKLVFARGIAIFYVFQLSGVGAKISQETLAKTVSTTRLRASVFVNDSES